MTLASLHQPNGMTTQVREACGAGRVRINGVCVARTTKRQVRREVRRCARWNAGVCVRYYWDATEPAGEERAAFKRLLSGRFLQRAYTRMLRP